MNILYEIFKKAQNGDESEKLKICKKFLPCIKSFGRKLFYEDAETDLTIFLLEFIATVDIEKFKDRCDGEITNYVYFSLKSKYLNLLKQKINKRVDEFFLINEPMYFDRYENIEREHISKLLKILNKKQQQIIVGRYIDGLSDIRLAEMFKISRQAVYKEKKKALELLKAELTKE